VAAAQASPLKRERIADSMANKVRDQPGEHNRSLRGALAGQIKHSVPPRSWQKEREQAWKRAAAESADRKKGE
jgi:hypothetical protein